MELMQANEQWRNRPDDERFLSLIDLQQHFDTLRANSRELTVSSRKIQCEPVGFKGIQITGPNGHSYCPSQWAFGQLAALAEAPAGYLRTLPAPIAADCVNYGLQFKRQVEDVGVLLHRNGDDTLRAATGPKYGRIWNADINRGLIDRFGDGRTGHFRIPGEFGQDVEITKANTTLYAGDRDMFVFLADEQNRIELPNRRDGKTGQLARGFFVWNSEVGAATFGVACFLFDYVCCNRIVWGAQEFSEITIRHTSCAPDRYIHELAPALERYSQGSTHNIVKAITDARNAKIDGTDGTLDKFLQSRFTKREGEKIKLAHLEDEGRPIETLWDVTVGATAYARSLGNQDERVGIERKAGRILDMVK